MRSALHLSQACIVAAAGSLWGCAAFTEVQEPAYRVVRTASEYEVRATVCAWQAL